MSWETALAIVSAIGGPTTLAALYKWAKAQGRADALAEEGRKALEAKNKEIAELEAENKRLWSVLESLTSPPEAS